ncbi:hypothetical protein BJX63DRAFT_148464 [Aspergillus granulosus]|uniref:Uncharacterized protein n=1 Tax=Aspergillus granulosus TaxID=176169 RepID=A0ABR4HKX9_9EURO
MKDRSALATGIPERFTLCGGASDKKHAVGRRSSCHSRRLLFPAWLEFQSPPEMAILSERVHECCRHETSASFCPRIVRGPRQGHHGSRSRKPNNTRGFARGLINRVVTQPVTGILILMISLLTVIILIDIVFSMLILPLPRAASCICIIQI